jgi:hypothetical protein
MLSYAKDPWRRQSQSVRGFFPSFEFRKINDSSQCSKMVHRIPSGSFVSGDEYSEILSDLGKLKHFLRNSYLSFPILSRKEMSNRIIKNKYLHPRVPDFCATLACRQLS